MKKKFTRRKSESTGHAITVTVGAMLTPEQAARVDAQIRIERRLQNELVSLVHERTKPYIVNTGEFFGRYVDGPVSKLTGLFPSKVEMHSIVTDFVKTHDLKSCVGATYIRQIVERVDQANQRWVKTQCTDSLSKWSKWTARKKAKVGTPRAVGMPRHRRESDDALRASIAVQVQGRSVPRFDDAGEAVLNKKGKQAVSVSAPMITEIVDIEAMTAKITGLGLVKIIDAGGLIQRLVAENRLQKCGLVRIVRAGERYNVQFVCDYAPEQATAKHAYIAVDRGIVRHATAVGFSPDGVIEAIYAMHPDRRTERAKMQHERNKKRYQSAMSRKLLMAPRDPNTKKRVKSGRYIEARRKHARQCGTEAAINSQVRVTIGRVISDLGEVAIFEDLKIDNMTKSSKGDDQQPGKRVKQKSGLNRSILGAGWGAMMASARYHRAWQGSSIIEVNPAYTSQTCPACGHVHRDNRVTQSRFECQDCGHADNADVVGAINIGMRGMTAHMGDERAHTHGPTGALPGSARVDAPANADMADVSMVSARAQADQYVIDVIFGCAKITKVNNACDFERSRERSNRYGNQSLARCEST